MQTIPWRELGLTATEVTEELKHLVMTWIILDRAWRKPFTVSSKFARQNAFLVALCASEEFITTNCGEDVWGNRWLISEHGMTIKGELDGVLQEILAATNGRYSPTH